jgi:hypothetical protein
MSLAAELPGASRHTVLENDSSHAERVQPGGRSLEQFTEFLPQAPQDARLGDPNGAGLHGEILGDINRPLTVDHHPPKGLPRTSRELAAN